MISITICSSVFTNFSGLCSTLSCSLSLETVLRCSLGKVCGKRQPSLEQKGLCIPELVKERERASAGLEKYFATLANCERGRRKETAGTATHARLLVCFFCLDFALHCLLVRFLLACGELSVVVRD